MGLTLFAANAGLAWAKPAFVRHADQTWLSYSSSRRTSSAEDGAAMCTGPDTTLPAPTPPDELRRPIAMLAGETGRPQPPNT
jgi:hypothetical protein